MASGLSNWKLGVSAALTAQDGTRLAEQHQAVADKDRETALSSGILPCQSGADHRSQPDLAGGMF